MNMLHRKPFIFFAPCFDEVIFIKQSFLTSVSGLTEDSHNHCEVYNPINDTWKPFASPKVQRTNHSLISSSSFIYAIGGEGPAGFEPVISMEKYDPSNDTWCFAPPMRVGKSGTCAVEVDKKIYVIGGSTGHNVLNSCDVFDNVTQEWNELQGEHKSGH